MLFLLITARLTTTDSSSTSKLRTIDSNEIYDSYTIKYHDEKSLSLLEEVGHGRFSKVHRATLSNGSIVAAKYLKPTEYWRVKREVTFLDLLRGIPHVIEFIGVYGDENSPIIVTEFASRDKNTNITLNDLKWAMNCLLSALNETHYRHVFHRDIKWQNLMVSFRERTLKIIDWGLAEYIVSDRKLSSRVGTKTYKAPELLMGAQFYGSEIDILAAGITMANLMFGCPSLFTGSGDLEILFRQIEIFGRLRMSRIAKELKYKRKIVDRKRRSFLEFALPHTRQLITSEALDLLEKLLMPEGKRRITAADALTHLFFTNNDKT
jgi:casein kinase II subunit alpha